MALTPANFPAAVKIIRQQAVEIQQLQLENDWLRKELEKSRSSQKPVKRKASSKE